jgi:hypothetical protein
MFDVCRRSPPRCGGKEGDGTIYSACFENTETNQTFGVGQLPARGSLEESRSRNYDVMLDMSSTQNCTEIPNSE